MSLSVMEPDQVRNLADSVLRMLGKTAASLACGCTKRFDVVLWASGESVPDDDQIERLIVISDLLDIVRTHYDLDMIRLWFIGQSYGVDGELSPAETIRVGNFNDARDSANRFIDLG